MKPDSKVIRKYDSEISLLEKKRIYKGFGDSIALKWENRVNK